MKKLWLGLILLLGFPVISFAEELTVAVAANARYPFEGIKAVFEKQNGVTVKSVIGSSGKFVTQIENGAPFDVFLSADMEYPEALAKSGFTADIPKIYAYGTLILWTLADIDLSKGIAVLTENSVHKIAIASPDTAPYGRQAVNALKHYGLYEKVAEKLVYGESVTQVNQFISSSP